MSKEDYTGELSVLNHLPAFRSLTESFLMSWPIMKSGRVEVGAVRPNQSVHFRVDAHAVEKTELMEWPVQFTRENRLKVNSLIGAIIETDAKYVRCNDLKPRDFVNRMTHGFYFSGSIDCGVFPRCNVSQSVINSC